MMTTISFKDYALRQDVRFKDIRKRGNGASRRIRNTLKKGLHTLHNLELMATNIYFFQITRPWSEINRRLIAAMCNEASHYSDFQVKLFEFGFRPFIFRHAYAFIGFAIGFVSKLLGKKSVLKTGIWVEKKAVRHYQHLLDTIDWDEDTRRTIEKNQQDEIIHIEHWQQLLDTYDPSKETHT